MDGKPKTLGLGPLHTVSLAEAREATQACRKMRLAGLDPIAEKKNRLAAAKFEAAKTITFKDCAEQYIEAHKAGWKTNRHTDKCGRSLELYAYPTLGYIPVAQIDTDIVFRTGDNPARLKGNLAHLLPPQK